MYKFKFLLLCIVLSSCIDADRIRQIGKTPDFRDSEIVEVTDLYPRTVKNIPKFIQKEEEKSVENKPVQLSNNGSLWASSNKQFFSQNNYKNIGDIIKVKIKISDKAALNNSTTTSRNSNEDTAAPNFLGFENRFKKMLPPTADLNALVSLTGANNNSGNGQISRKEDVNAQIAAVVTNILPNGNVVIQGSQEIRVNYEIRELTIQGIVNPKDLTQDDNINLEQIAEARISYGGRGAITNVQQPRIGVQIIDAVSPF